MNAQPSNPKTYIIRIGVSHNITTTSPWWLYGYMHLSKFIELGSSELCTLSYVTYTALYKVLLKKKKIPVLVDKEAKNSPLKRFVGLVVQRKLLLWGNIMWTFCKNLLFGNHDSMCFWLSIPWLKCNSLLKCREDEAKSWPRSSSADGVRGGWQPSALHLYNIEKRKTNLSHLLFLFVANFCPAHCVQELRGSHMCNSSGLPNLQGQTYISWLRNEASQQGFSWFHGI